MAAPTPPPLDGGEPGAVVIPDGMVCCEVCNQQCVRKKRV